MGNPNDPSKGGSGFVVSDGEHIYYETYGQGNAIVFCHGLGGNHVIWYQQVAEFARSYRVVTWDQRGFGRSSNRGNRADPDASISDLKAVLDHLHIEKAHLIGQSMGGIVVMGLALQNPERVGTLVLGDTNGGIYSQGIEEAFNAFLKKAASSPASAKMPIGQHPALGEKLRQVNSAQAFLYEQIGTMAGDPPKNITTLYRNIAYPHEKLRKLRIPVLFIVGEEDPIFPPEIVREVASVISNSHVIVIPSAGHSPYFEAPQRWNTEVSKFLRHQILNSRSLPLTSSSG